MPTRQEQQIEHWRNEKLLRGARKDAPRRPKEGRVRRRVWLPEDLADLESWDEIDAPQFERVMPRGEAERRRQNLTRAQAGDRPAEGAEGAEGPSAGAYPAEESGDMAPSAPAAARGSTPDASQAGRHLRQEQATPSAATVRAAGASTRPAAGFPANGGASQLSASSGRPVSAGAGPSTPGSRFPAYVPAAMPALVRPGTGAQPAQRIGARPPDALPWAVQAGSQAQSAGPGQIEGLVVEVAAGLCRVASGDSVRLCTLRGALAAADTGLTNAVAVGDRVTLRPDSADRGVVEAVLPRRSLLARPDVALGHLRQPIAANADQLLVVAAWRDPAFWPELVDRYLVTAARSGLQPIIAVNKIDLAADLAEARAALRPYMALAYRVIFTSALAGQGVADLRAALAGHMTVLAGLSGVGKSSLLSAVQPGLQLRAAEVSDHWHQGRHTTTQASLHRLENGGHVMDTPGIREFGLAGLRRGELAAYYPELAALAGSCRFADCAHRAEPGCAVQAALRQGRIAPVRFDSYQKIYATLPA